MSELLECEFFVVRYMPNVIRGEFVNIGIVLHEIGLGKTIVRFTRDWTRAAHLDPDIDVEMLEALEAEMRQGMGESRLQFQAFRDMVKDSFSNALQFTAGQGCLPISLSSEIDRLMKMHVEPLEVVRGVGLGRQSIRAALCEQLKAAGVWDRMQKQISVATYTRPGDPMRIDCGHSVPNVMKMFHAVSLEGELETPKALAFSMTPMREGIRRVENVDLQFTAIVEALDDVRGGLEEGDRTEKYRFAVETMENHGIRVISTRDLALVAEEALLAISA